jgi:hypothetical protein
VSNGRYNKEALEREMKRRQFPEGFRLKRSPIGIDVVDRTYGIVCECGSKEFSEDNVFGKLFCSECNKQLAIRAEETGWVDEEGNHV